MARQSKNIQHANLEGKTVWFKIRTWADGKQQTYGPYMKRPNLTAGYKEVLESYILYKIN